MLHLFYATVVSVFSAAPERAIIELKYAGAPLRLGDDVRVLRRYSKYPFVAVQAQPEVLKRIARLDQVQKVHSDVRVAPDLAESTPLIGAPAAALRGATGAGVAVAIVDSGVDAAHSFFGGRVVAEACFSDACPNGQMTEIGPGAAAPCGVSACRHGTHVAGIAAGEGASLSGVATDARLVAVQVFSVFQDAASCYPSAPPCILAWSSDLIAALEHVESIAAQHSIAAVNMSLGGGLHSGSCPGYPIEPVIADLRAAGVAPIVASGNSGSRSQIAYPACVPGAISVGATTDVDTVASFSDVSSRLDLFAPGTSIVSSVPNNGYLALNGTSMAAPHVAGAWAVLAAAAPDRMIPTLLDALSTTGQLVLDTRSGGTITRPRIRVDRALDALLGRPDLRISAVTAPQFLAAGQSIVVNVTVTNAGTGYADAQQVGLWHSTDSFRDANDTLLALLDVAPLGAGSSSSLAAAVDLPAPLATGTHYLVAAADAAMQISESNERNNARARSVRVGPDLQVHSIAGPQIVTSGQTVRVSVTTRNAGGDVAPPSVTRVYYSADATLDAGDPSLDVAIPEIPAVSIYRVAGSLIVPQLASGRHYVFAVADVAETILETQENNNVRSRSFDVP